MGTVLDISRIEKELQQINQQRSETRERLDALRGNRGRGRGPPGGGGRGVFSRLGDNSMNGGPGPRDPAGPGRPSVFDRLYSQGSRSSAGPPPDRPDRDAAAAADGRQPLGKRLSSRISGEVVVAADVGTEEADRERADAAPAGRKRLLSAVVVNGRARQLSGSFDRVEAEPAPEPVEERPLKRPTLAVDDKTKRRAARMFGTLLVGTLQKFQNDEQAFKRTDTAQRRAEMEKRAQEKAEADAQRLREQAATAHREEREAKFNALHDLNLQAEIKALELRYAKRIQQRQQLGGFCITSTQPPLYWLPKQVSKESQPLLQQAEDALEAWKQEQLQALETERAELTQAAAAKREAALARLSARQNAGAGDEDGDGTAGNGADRSEGEEGAEEDEQQDPEEQGTGFALGEEQQGDDGDMRDAAAAEGADDDDEQQQQQEEVQPRVRRSRRVGSDDDDEERLLSSDDE